MDFIYLFLFHISSQPFLELGVSLLHGEILDGIAQCLDLSDEHANLFGSRDGGVDEVALQEGEETVEHRDDHDGIFRALALVDGDGSLLYLIVLYARLLLDGSHVHLSLALGLEEVASSLGGIQFQKFLGSTDFGEIEGWEIDAFFLFL